MSARRASAVACLLVALLAGCNRAADDVSDPGELRAVSAPGAAGAVAARAGAAARPGAGPAAGDGAAAQAAGAAASPGRLPRVVFLGDSLTAGYGVALDEAFPAVVGRLLAAEGRPVEVVNAGVSGDTSAGGLARAAWTLRAPADVLVLCLGANDGLRGQPPSATARQLRGIIEVAQAAGVRVLLAGVQLPPNYGPDYTAEFAAIFPALARELDVPLVPSLLAGVGGDPELNQGDGVHPTAEGHRRLAANVLPQLRALLAGD